MNHICIVRIDSVANAFVVLRLNVSSYQTAALIARRVGEGVSEAQRRWGRSLGPGRSSFSRLLAGRQRLVSDFSS